MCDFFAAQGFAVKGTVPLRCTSVHQVRTLDDNMIIEAAALCMSVGTVDAVVQSGTALACASLARRIENQSGSIGVPILTANATALWYALRAIGITDDMPAMFGSFSL